MPVNVPPAPLVEDITSAVAIHRASVAVRSCKESKQTETPRQVLSMVGRGLKRLFSPPAPPARPPAVVAPPAPDREPESLTVSEGAAAWRTIVGKALVTPEVVNMTCAMRPMEILYGHELASQFGAQETEGRSRPMVSGFESGGSPTVDAAASRSIREWGGSSECSNGPRPRSWCLCCRAFQGIATVTALRPGRTTAPERLPVLPVDDAEKFKATLPFLSPRPG